LPSAVGWAIDSSPMAARSSYVPASNHYAHGPASQPPASGHYETNYRGHARQAPTSVVPASIPPASTQDPRLFMKGFFVHVEGSEPVGPVSANQVARGIKAGKIPAEASIQWQGELWWKGVYDEPAVIAALKAL
jgi:hypothetical protein